MPKNLTKEQLYIILGLIASIIIGSGVCIYNKCFAPAPNNEVIINEPVEEMKAEVQVKSQIIVHISGEVRKEGVYKLEEGDRVLDAVKMAGGTTNRADLSPINLAKVLTDGEKIVIPKKKPLFIANSNASNPGQLPSTGGELVNINTADEKTLQTIPGVGPSTAKSIIDYRAAKGNFSKIEDIMNVPRIKKNKFEKIKDRITVY